MTREASIRRRQPDVNGVVGQCRDCGRDMGSNRNRFGLLVHAGHGQCTSCRSAIDRAKKKAGELPAPRRRVVAADESWRDDAACVGTDTESFFPEKGGSTREAKRVCNNGCPVRKECLDFALRERNGVGRFGIYGGLSERERRQMYRAQGTGSLDRGVAA